VKPEKEQIIEYGLSQAMLIARFIEDITMNIKQHGASFAQQYILQKGLKVFGKQGHQALKKEIDQLHKRTCFAPLKVKDMKPSKRKKAQMALMFLTEKRDKSVKGRMVYNRKPTREWLLRKDAASPTAALESIMITGVIKAKEQREVMMCDIPNAFIQALLRKKDPGEDRVVMKITGVLVDMLVDINPKLYGPAMVLENRKKVLYIEVLKAIYGMLEAALLWKKDVPKTPASDSLFNLGTGAKLDTKRSEIFHTFVAKGLFLCKRARPDIQQAISVLCTRVKDPNQADWEKLMRVMKYLNGTRNEYLVTLSADNLRVVKWYVDASFAVHPDFKSHTGAVMTLGKGAMQSIARKQKMNVRSSTEGELVAVDNAATMILWTKLFLEAQGYDVEKNIVYHDNKSAIFLETNGKKSLGKQTRALNICYFFITDQVEKGNSQIEHCGTDNMAGDFFTKPLQGEKFQRFRNNILGR
jgi:hypothetical protein